jgi:ABC-type transporter Mla subunit MlaD
LVVAVVGLGAWLSTVAIDGLPWSSSYQVRLDIPAGAPLLHAGDDVRIGGELAGQVQSVALAPRSRDLAIATLTLDSGFRIGSGASARVRPRGLAGAVYVDLNPGNLAHAEKSGTLIRASAGAQVTDVISAFNFDARRALQQVLTGYGTGLAGRGVSLGRSLRATPALLSNTAAVLSAADPAPGLLERDVGDSTALAQALSSPNTIPRLIGAAASVFQTTGADGRQIQATLRAVPGIERAAADVLPAADRLMARLGTTVRTLTPGIDALATALPSVLAIEHAGPQLSALGRVAHSAAPALRALAPPLTKLIGPASGLTPLSSPIAELASVLIPYRNEIIQAPLGFTRWGNFRYDFGTGAGHRAVRFSMILTCAHARDPYPAPGAAVTERKPCP